MSTHDAQSINLERETIEALQNSLCQQIALFKDDKESSTVKGGDGGNSISSLERFLNRGSMEARIKAAEVIEKLANIDREATMRMIVLGSNSVIGGLLRLLRQDNIPHAMKASLSALAALYNGATEEAEIMLLITQQKGGVETLIEHLAGARTAKAERVLIVLNAISLCTQGQAALTHHALTVPVLVRSLLVLSALANELAIAVLWVLCLHNRSAGGSYLQLRLLEEAAHLGVAHKLLVIAQMEHNLHTKRKVRDLFKAMSGFMCLTSLYGSQRL